MATTYSIVIDVEWVVNQGVLTGKEAIDPTPDPNSATGYVNHIEFQWDDTNAGLIDGPTQLTGFWVEGRAYIDTRTIVTDDETGEVASDTVARQYPAWNLTSQSIESDLTDDWVDATNPAKPKQYEGPILYKMNELTTPVPMVPYGTGRVGILENSATFLGFVNGKASLPDSNGGAGNNSFFIDLETGRGYVWALSLPGAVTPPTKFWVNSGLAHNPALINTTPLESTDDLDLEAEIGSWQVVNVGTYGTVYAKTEEGWLNIGPVQLGGASPLVTIPADVQKSYVSGYIYPLVFDRSRFFYVPRMSGESQETYEGEISILETGWFPQEPHDPELDIYPMDSVTRVRPDDRTYVTGTYTVTMTGVASYIDPYTGLPTQGGFGSVCTVYQDIYQPTYNWGDVIHQLLDLTYFKHGIYH